MADQKAVENHPEKKRKSHLFQPGKSGNPSGRPLGKQPTTLLQEALAEKLGEANTKQGRERALKTFFRRVLDQALDERDTQALGLVLKRISPELKATEQPTPVGIDTSAPDVEIARQILSEVAGGVISVEQGTKLIGVVAARHNLAQAAELAERLTQLEKQINDDR